MDMLLPLSCVAVVSVLIYLLSYLSLGNRADDLIGGAIGVTAVFIVQGTLTGPSAWLAVPVAIAAHLAAVRLRRKWSSQRKSPSS